MHVFSLLGVAVLLLLGCSQSPEFDVVLRHGLIYDGTGAQPFVGDVALTSDSIAAIGSSVAGRGKREIEVKGLAVAPGFVNMLSWATESLI